MSKTIRVLIADDHAIVREGLKQILVDTKNIVVTATAADGAEAVKLARKHPNHVLLLDISLPDRSGIDVLKQLRKEIPTLPVLMLSMHREDLYAIRSIKAGAMGYLTKQSAPAELVTALQEVANGRKYIGPLLAQQLADAIQEGRDILPHEKLSDREYQTLTMIASGKSVSDIANELSLSVKTISMYRTRLLQKMQLKHNAELTHYVIKNQLS